MTTNTTGSSMDTDKLKSLFIRYDFNKNGVLDKDELVVYFYDILKEIGEEFPEKKNQQVAEECLEKYDANKNEKLEFSEFYNLMDFLVNEKGYKLK